MSGNLIITIGRQSGSGGKKIGEMLAEKLGVKCYDKELLAQAAKHSGLCEELFEKHDERPTSSFLYSLVMDSYSMGYTATGYSDYALEDYPNVVSVFITGDEADKIKRVSELYNVDEAKAKDLMIKTDKRRSSYYNYYSNKKWGDPKSYDMCINSSAVGQEGAVDIIMELAKKKQEWKKQK